MAEKKRLQKVDDLVRRDHYYLAAEDVCIFWGEYTAQKGYSHSATNSLISNLKKKMDKKGSGEWKYKGIAIEQTAKIFKDRLNPAFLKVATVVPRPPSKAKTEPLYDDRMLQVAQRFASGCDVRELLVMRKSDKASHERDDRPNPDDLEKILMVDESVAKPTPKTILLVDDVLTTGAHFVAAKRVLQRRFPGVDVTGLFAARRVPQSDFDPADVDALFGELKKKK